MVRRTRGYVNNENEVTLQVARVIRIHSHSHSHRSRATTTTPSSAHTPYLARLQFKEFHRLLYHKLHRPPCRRRKVRCSILSHHHTIASRYEIIIVCLLGGCVTRTPRVTHHSSHTRQQQAPPRPATLPYLPNSVQTAPRYSPCTMDNSFTTRMNLISHMSML